MLTRFAKAISQTANLAAIAALLFMFGHIVLEIALRNLFARSTFVLDEFVGYAVSALTFLALGETLRKEGLIRVTVLRDNLMGWGRKMLDIFALLSALAVGCFAVWFVGKSVLRSFARGTTSSSIAEVPQWLPESLVLIGLAVFVLQSFAGLLERFAMPAEADCPVESD